MASFFNHWSWAFYDNAAAVSPLAGQRGDVRRGARSAPTASPCSQGWQGDRVGHRKVLGGKGVLVRAQCASVSPTPPAAGGLGPQGRAGTHRCAGLQGPTAGNGGSCVYGAE